MVKNDPSLITSTVLVLALAYLLFQNQSEAFAQFTRVFHENIDNVLFIVLAMFIALYYLRIHGVSTETFCGAENPFKRTSGANRCYLPKIVNPQVVASC